MQACYLAVDIGASSGRHIVGWVEDGRIQLQEVYRFENGISRKNGHLCWNVDALAAEVINGMAACRAAGFAPATMGIDTWAVDFVLLDKAGQRIGDAVAYRDERTDGIREMLPVSFAKHYARTGIQFQKFNTVYQLAALQKEHPEQLAAAETFLMIPDYLNYLLTGVAANEYTNATTTALVNAESKDWDDALIETLGWPRRIFQPIRTPGNVLGGLLPEIQEKVGFNCQVILPASHDTGSAFLAVPARDEFAVTLSSGTWSLLGVENAMPIATPASRADNFTNEGGYQYRFRFLKNIMGLWMIQSVRRELPEHYSFSELCDLARESQAFPSRVDVNADVFLAPESMINAIQLECARTMQPVPQTPGELAEVIYQSLAESYAKAIKELEQLTGIPYDEIHIVGGGSNAEYLNELTAEKSGLRVLAGPAEATAIGNLAAQMIAAGVFADYREARKCILQSCEVKCYSHTSIA